MRWTIKESEDGKKGKRRMKIDFFCTRLHPSCTQPNNKGLADLANPLLILAGATRFELATFGVTGRRSNQLNYAPDYLALSYER